MRILAWIATTILLLFGSLSAAIYLVALAASGDRETFVADYGALFAFSVVGAVVGVLGLLSLIRRLPERIPIPNVWIALVGFLVAVGAGFVIVRGGRLPGAAPLLALLAAAMLFAFIARFVSHWSVQRAVGSREVVLPALWGMVGAPLAAGGAQLVTVLLLLIGGATGIYVADAGLVDQIEGWVSDTSAGTDLSVIQTPTVAFGALSVVGIAAPLTEELAKFLGVYFVFRKRVATKYGLFLAGAAAGLGFAVVESLGYALMAIEQWPQVMLLRAPVALIHVAATTIVALGWYKQRQSGGYWLIGMYVLAVLLHAAWNSLFVTMMIIAAGFETSEELSPVDALLTLAIICAFGALLVAAVLWIAGNARRLGREARPVVDPEWSPHPPAVIASPTSY